MRSNVIKIGGCYISNIALSDLELIRPKAPSGSVIHFEGRQRTWQLEIPDLTPEEITIILRRNGIIEEEEKGHI